MSNNQATLSCFSSTRMPERPLEDSLVSILRSSMIQGPSSLFGPAAEMPSFPSMSSSNSHSCPSLLDILTEATEITGEDLDHDSMSDEMHHDIFHHTDNSSLSSHGQHPKQ
ncbi:unnamed protein product [Cylindrotheca closterium]|uniref:Uncharacterized protein n=1 Tax=Cylindrotheca closterium TaxID=2856 RepID=A0AAD2G1I7_9STRA|nr:unnamed protein product [Cylindrotheca closterium]